MSFVANMDQIDSNLRRVMELKKCHFESQIEIGDHEFILKPICTVVQFFASIAQQPRCT